MRVTLPSSSNSMAGVEPTKSATMIAAQSPLHRPRSVVSNLHNYATFAAGWHQQCKVRLTAPSTSEAMQTAPLARK